MARIETDPNYTAPTFSRATAPTDPFKKEDVQNVAAALSTHDHTTGKGLPMAAGSIPNGTITSAMLADGTIDTAALKDGAVTSAKIADGTIATADVADQAVTNAKLAADTARANLLTNGGFEIWQRGAGPFTTTLAYCADRWIPNIGAGSTMSVARSQANAGPASNYCAWATYTHSTVSSLFQELRAAEQKLAGKTVTLSVQVWTSTANGIHVALNDGVTSAASASHSGTSSLQTLSVSLPIAQSSTTLTIGINMTASGQYFIDNAMLVVGSVPADYAPLHPADELARCQRYYEVVGADFNVTAYGAASIACMTPIPYKVRKAVNPTVTKVGTWNINNCSQPAPGAGSIDIVSLAAIVTSTGTYSFSNTSVPSAVISAEANP
jgi:hypothetical protein